MTDLEVLAVLDRLEPLLAVPADLPNDQAVAQWHEAFKQALAGAEHGPRWPEVQARAKVLGVLLSRRVAQLQSAQEALRRSLGRVATGRRALNAYGQARRS
ncbi:MAG: hypothetical protein ABSH53_10075 [Holophaga sp.]|jgi:hypothetical protein